MTDYEVRCMSCDVSFPTGTRACLYCGEKPVAPGAAAGRRLFPRSLPGMTKAAPDPSARGGPMPDNIQLGEGSIDLAPMPGGAASRHEPRPILGGPEDEDEEPTLRGTLPRILTSVAWVLLFVVVSIYRACTSP